MAASLNDMVMETHRRRHLAYLMADRGAFVGNPDAAPNLPKQHLSRLGIINRLYKVFHSVLLMVRGCMGFSPIRELKPSEPFENHNECESENNVSDFQLIDYDVTEFLYTVENTNSDEVFHKPRGNLGCQSVYYVSIPNILETIKEDIELEL